MITARLPSLPSSLLPWRRPTVPVVVETGSEVIEPDSPLGDIRTGLLIVAVFFGLFLGWAAVFRLDAAAYAEGAVAVVGSRRVVQHPDGGVVSAIHVREGQSVRAGQILIELAADEIRAAERAATAQVISLQARRARLLAEQQGAETITPPVEFARLPEEDKAEAERALLVERAELHARRASAGSQRGVISQQSLQITQEIAGYRQQLRAQDEQLRLAREELAGLEHLAGRGFVSANRVRALQRTTAALEGSRAELAAAIARAQARIGESRAQGVNLGDQRSESVAAALHEVSYQLNDVLPRRRVLREQLARTQLRAPASGQVVGLSVFTVGGVIGSGEKLMEVVPDRAPLVIEARVSPDDADDLYPGLESEVRVTGLRGQDVPRLSGELTRVSADVFTDERTGAMYYTATVTVPSSALEELSRMKRKVKLRPGMPAQVVIPLRKRTALQYLTEPFSQAFWRSFREH